MENPLINHEWQPRDLSAAAVADPVRSLESTGDDPPADAVKKVYTGPREVCVVLDEATATGYRVRADYWDITKAFPGDCRWIPDYRALRKAGAIAGAFVALSALMIGVVIGLKENSEIGTMIGFAAVMLTGPLAAAGWFAAPYYRHHDYRSFTVLRRITKGKDDDPPSGAWAETHETDDGQLIYIVPYRHSFLNLANVSEESGDSEIAHPFVARASTLFHDSKQESLAHLMSAKPDGWSRVKQLGLLGVIGIEAIFLFLMLNIING